MNDDNSEEIRRMLLEEGHLVKFVTKISIFTNAEKCFKKI